MKSSKTKLKSPTPNVKSPKASTKTSTTCAKKSTTQSNHVQHKPGGPFLGMHLKLQPREVYGRDLIYSACPISNALIGMSGKKTWTRHEIDHALEMGATIEYISRYIDMGDI